MFSKLQELMSGDKINLYKNMQGRLQKAADFLMVPKLGSPNRVNIFVSSMNKLKSKQKK